MKKLILLSALLSTASLLSAQSFTQFFTGSFIDGDLAGFTVEGLFEIDTDGQASGTADLSGIGPEILAFEFVIFDTTPVLFTDFTEFDDPLALATFDTIAPATEPQVTTFDFLGTNFGGETLNFFYDAFAANPATAFSVSFDDGSGNVSNASLDLATAVPEPGAFSLAFGLGALGYMAIRRR